MDKVLLDTNIIIDYLSSSRPHHLEAVMLLEGLLDSPNVDPVVLVSSIKDAYYILVRHYGREDIVRDRLKGFCEIVEMSDLTRALLFDAFGSDEPDVEDGIIHACAERMGALALVTRDKDAFSGSAIPVLDAHEFRLRFADVL